MASKPPHIALVAHSFNGRTAASGAAYWGSNPWWAAKYPLTISDCLYLSRRVSTYLDTYYPIKSMIYSIHPAQTCPLKANLHGLSHLPTRCLLVSFLDVRFLK